MRSRVFYLMILLTVSFVSCKKDSTIYVDDVKINQTFAVLTPGEKVTLTATIIPDDAVKQTLFWDSDAPSVATVDGSGLVTAVSAGTAKITAKTGNGKKAACDVTVTSNQMTFTTQAIGSITIGLKGEGSIAIHWDDGVIDTRMLSSSISYYSHNYSETLTRTITIIGAKITLLNCNDNQLTEFDSSKNPVLTQLNCSNNQLKSLVVSKNTALTHLYCWSNQLASLDVSKNTALTHLYCWNNQLTSLDVSKNTELISLSCGNNRLINLNVKGLAALSSLYCDNNRLTSLDLSDCTSLWELKASTNRLPVLYLSRNVMLRILYCDVNLLTSLDVSQNVMLTTLSCEMNRLTSLNLSLHTNLKDLNCSFNVFPANEIDALFGTLHDNSIQGGKTIDISYNPGIKDCHQNIATGKGWKVVVN